MTRRRRRRRAGDGAARATRAAGRKLLVPYITGGLPGWQDAVRAAAAAGADAIEIGIPFSDPVMDGPVIQEASQRALRGRAPRPMSILDELARPRRRHPARGDDLLQHRLPRRPRALRRSAAPRPASRRRSCPTCRSRRSGPWCEAADAAGIETVMLAAPDRARRAPAADLRPGARLRLRRRPARRDRRARPRWRRRRRRSPPAEGGHRHAGARRRRRVERRAGRARPCRSPTASSRARRSCAGCWRRGPDAVGDVRRRGARRARRC